MQRSVELIYDCCSDIRARISQFLAPIRFPNFNMNPSKNENETIHAEHHHSGIEKQLSGSANDIKGHDFSIDAADLPKRYFRSPTFLGSMFAIGLSLACGVGGFALFAPILAISECPLLRHGSLTTTNTDAVNSDIGPSQNLTWVALTYTLTTGVCLVIVGRVTDLFGRRWFMTCGTALGLVGSIVGATASTINGLIAAETLIGLGASTQISFAL